MRNFKAFLLVPVVMAMLAMPSTAKDYRLGSLVISNPYAVIQDPGGAINVYMTVKNDSGSVERIIEAYASGATRSELHQQAKAGDPQSMQELDSLDVPAGGKLELKPGGYHIALFGMHGTPTPGDSIRLQLEFEFAGRANIEAVVTKPAAAGMAPAIPSTDSPTQ